MLILARVKYTPLVSLAHSFLNPARDSMRCVESHFSISQKEKKELSISLYEHHDTSLGTVFLVHGLGGWKDQHLLKTVAQRVSSCGFRVVSFDARDGAGARQGNFFKSSTSAHIEDLNDVFSWARTQGFNERNILIGHSLGGLIALHHAVKKEHSISALVLLAPARGLFAQGLLTVLFAFWRAITVGIFYTTGPLKKKFPLHRSWFTDFLSYDARAYVKNVSVPVLVIGAEKDRLIGKPKLLRAFSKKFAHGKFVEIKNANHAFEGKENEVTDRITAWLTTL